MLKSWGWVALVAYMVLETAQSPNSSFPFLTGLELGIWDLDLGLSIQIKKWSQPILMKKFSKTINISELVSVMCVRYLLYVRGVVLASNSRFLV